MHIFISFNADNIYKLLFTALSTLLENGCNTHTHTHTQTHTLTHTYTHTLTHTHTHTHIFMFVDVNVSHRKNIYMYLWNFILFF